MSSYKKVDIKEISVSFASEIEKLLKEYGDGATETVFECAEDTANNTKKMLAGNSPKKTGKYAKGWKKQTETKRYSKSFIVYEGKKPTLTWLLNNGHALWQGGRFVGNVYGDGHIADAEEYADGYFYDEVIRRLSHDL